MILILCIISVYIPIDSWSSEVLEELQVRGVHFTNFPSVRPYDSRLLDEMPVMDIPDINFIYNLSSSFRLDDTMSVLRVKPGVFYDWSEFSVCAQPVVKFGEDEFPPDHVFLDLFSADYERAYAKYTSSHFDVFVGRERFSVGPSLRNNLLVSGYSMPMDWLGYALSSKVLKLSFFISRLDSVYDKTIEYVNDTITAYTNSRRYLTIKRLDVTPLRWLNIGITEAALFGGENYALELFHFNPVVFIQAYQYNWAHESNFLLQLDAKVFLHNSVLYGALLVDDFQLEKDPNDEPHHLGINVGMEHADPFNIKGIFWLTEYTGLTRYTYCHFFPYQRYQYRGSSIGAPHGPDHDEFFTKITYHLTPTIDVYSSVSLLRKGETTIFTLWPIPENPRAPGTTFPENNFLSGIVERTLTTQLGIRVFYRRWLTVGLSMGMRSVTNHLHAQGDSKNDFILTLELDAVRL